MTIGFIVECIDNNHDRDSGHLARTTYHHYYYY